MDDRRAGTEADDAAGEPMGEQPPGSPRLDRAPGERYAVRQPAAEDEAVSGGSIARAAAFAAPAALIALMVYVALAGPFAFSAGLVIVAIFAGRIIGLSAKAGGGRAITSDQAVLVALVVTLAWFVLAQVTTWAYARSEGGVLPILDYVLDAFGPVVPLVAIASVLSAWWSAR